MNVADFFIQDEEGKILRIPFQQEINKESVLFFMDERNIRKRPNALMGRINNLMS